MAAVYSNRMLPPPGLLSRRVTSVIAYISAIIAGAKNNGTRQLGGWPLSDQSPNNSFKILCLKKYSAGTLAAY